MSRDARTWKLPIGTVVEDRFRIDAPISATHLSQIFKATDLTTQIPVALKLLHIPDATSDELDQMASRFEREIQVYTRLDHPHLIGFIARGNIGQRNPYMVLDYVDGTSLYETVCTQGPLSPTESKRIMLQCLDALSLAHSKGIVHRDLKPENIMLTGEPPSRDAILIDYGLAGIRNWRSMLGIDRRITFAGQVPGTPQYVAPEQIGGDVTTASDIYTWALVFVECLTGKTLVQGKRTIDVLHAHVQGRVRDMLPARLVAHPLGAILRSALDKDPKARPNAKQLLKQLQALGV